MLYELIAIVRPGNLNEVKEIARSTGQQILTGGGVIRGLRNWGVFSLPKRLRKHQAWHQQGHYFIMQFDSSATIQTAVTKSLGLDPRMIRFSLVKLGSRLKDMKDFSGEIRWKDGGHLEDAMRDSPVGSRMKAAYPTDRITSAFEAK